MTTKSKQEELRRKISDNLVNLMIKCSLKKLSSNKDIVQSGKEYIAMHAEELDSIVETINSECLALLEKVKSKQVVCDTFHSFGITKRIDAVPLSAIEEIEKEYK